MKILRTIGEIQRRIIFFSVGVVLAAVLLVEAVLVIYGQNKLKANLTEIALAKTAYIASSSAAAIKLGDRELLERKLNSVIQEPRTIGISVTRQIDDTTVVFHQMLNHPNQNIPNWSVDEQQVKFGDGYIDVYSSVQLDGDWIGNVTYRFDTSEVSRFMFDAIEISAFILISVLILTLGIAGLVSRTIAGPIMHLAMRAREVAEKNDYTIRIDKVFAGELEVLKRTFNLMMERIQFTDAKRTEVENQLRELNTNLEKRISERTTELLISKNSAESANKAKSLFLANMSHEIRTPMNAILGYAQLMQSDKDIDLKSREMAVTIGECGNQLMEMVNGILDISKFEAEKMSIELVDFEFYPFIADLESQFKGAAQQKGLAFKIEYGKDLPRFIKTDQNKLRQVLINLVRNALEYTESGAISLRIFNESDSSISEKTTLQFEVSDTGRGIESSRFQEIFNPFSQAEIGIQIGGTGLGLPLSKQIIQLLGGKIWLTSQVGKGSQFIFTLPVIRSSIEQLKQKEKFQPVAGLASGQDIPKVLVVDDKKLNRDLLSRVLTPMGFPVIEAQDGLDAIQQFKLEQPKIILMDVLMPKLNGIEATKEIKAQAKDDVVIIAVTASADDNDVREIFRCGASAVIRKPVQLDELLNTMAKHAQIKLIYLDRQTESNNTRSKDEPLTLTQNAIDGMPDALKAKITDAVKAGNIAKLREYVDEFIAWDNGLGLEFQALIKRYRLSEIKQIFKEKGKTASKK